MIKIENFNVDFSWANLEPKDVYRQYESIRDTAAISYNKESVKSSEEFVAMIMKKGHYTVLEQTNIAVKFNKETFDTLSPELFAYYYLSKYIDLVIQDDGYLLVGNLRGFYDSCVMLEDKEMIEKREKSLLEKKVLYDITMVNLYYFFYRHYDVVFNIFEGSSYRMRNQECLEIGKNVNLGLKFIEAKDIPFNLQRIQFLVTCSRDVSHQIVRHRCLSVNQESQRKVKYEVEYPIAIVEKDKEMVDVCVKNLELCHLSYLDLLQQKYVKSRARKILNSLARTKLYLCGRIKDWEMYLNLRTTKETQYDHRYIAQSIEIHLQNYKNRTLIK